MLDASNKNWIKTNLKKKKKHDFPIQKKAGEYSALKRHPQETNRTITWSLKGTAECVNGNVFVKMADISFSPRAYCKMLLHCAKYPHCAVNGVLLAENPKNKDFKNENSLLFIDAIPLFHICLHLSPMYEVALTQVNLSNLFFIIYFICICESIFSVIYPLVN